MYRRDAIELAAGIQLAGYYDWVYVSNGLVYQSCCECGLSHALVIEPTGPTTFRVRFTPEEALTEAIRENDKMEIPLHKEVIALREENLQLKRKLEWQPHDRNHPPSGEVIIHTTEGWVTAADYAAGGWWRNGKMISSTVDYWMPLPTK